MDLAAEVVAVREDGDVATILETERTMLRDEYERFANTPLTKASLAATLEEVDAALAMVEMVRDPETYRVRVDETHRVRKHRTGGVPKDDARVFFAGHITRLADWEKARGTDEAKAVLSARRASMRRAGKIYQGLQRAALGITDTGVAAADSACCRGCSRAAAIVSMTTSGSGRRQVRTGLDGPRRVGVRWPINWTRDRCS